MRLFGTNVLIEHLKANPAATTLLLEASADGHAACSVLTRVQLLAGMRATPQNPENPNPASPIPDCATIS